MLSAPFSMKLLEMTMVTTFTVILSYLIVADLRFWFAFAFDYSLIHFRISHCTEEVLQKLLLAGVDQVLFLVALTWIENNDIGVNPKLAGRGCSLRVCRVCNLYT